MKQVFTYALLAELAWSGLAYGYATQIRIDENTCKNFLPDYIQRKNNPLYAKALAAQKAGKANAQQRQRIATVGLLHDALKFAKCKGVK
jgi:hypothetical protein